MDREDWDTRQYLRENTGIIGNASRSFGRQREFMNMDRAGGLTGGSTSRAMSRNYTAAPAGLKPWTSEFQFDKPSFSLSTATAAGVAPDFYRKGPQEVNLSRGSNVVGSAIATGLGAAAEKAIQDGKLYKSPLSDEERGYGQKRVTLQSRNALRQYKQTKQSEQPWAQMERDLDEGVVTGVKPYARPEGIPDRIDSSTREDMLVSMGQPWRQAGMDFDEGSVTFSPYRGSSQNLPVLYEEPPSNKFGIPDEGQTGKVRMTGPTMPVLGDIPQGPIRFAGELEQVAGTRREQPVTEAPPVRRTPPGTGRAVGGRTTEGTEAEPRVLPQAPTPLAIEIAGTTSGRGIGQEGLRRIRWDLGSSSEIPGIERTAAGRVGEDVTSVATEMEYGKGLAALFPGAGTPPGKSRTSNRSA